MRIEIKDVDKDYLFYFLESIVQDCLDEEDKLSIEEFNKLLWRSAIPFYLSKEAYGIQVYNSYP